MNTSRAATAYRCHAAQTASKTQLVVMLTSRMASDIAQAITAITDRAPADAHRHLVHAQDIIDELDNALDSDMCPAGADLRSLYNYVREQLVEANVGKDTTAATNAHQIAVQIADMFRAAATEQAA